MSLFLTAHERKALHEARKGGGPMRALYWSLLNRAEEYASSPGLSTNSTTTAWWHHASEYLTDGAMAFALKPSAFLSAWVRDVTLSLVRRPLSDWIGPGFRSHAGDSPVGHLETAHLTWAVAVALDLAPEAFTETERTEIAGALREKGIALCRRWLDQNTHLSNWRCVLNAGVCVAAAVLDDAAELERAEKEFRLGLEIFQPDGSSGESLQYGNYAAYAQTLAWESLVRRRPDLAVTLPMVPYVHLPRWQAASYFYQKPLSGWGAQPLPRAANFNDSAAIFRPSADVLAHIANRGKIAHPTEAGLARWLFDATYLPLVPRTPADRASFGFVNDYGFLTLALLAEGAAPMGPEEAGISTTAVFSCGDVIARDAWKGRTILAARGGGDPLHGPGHLHGDLNSFILVHNEERLLVDPGHSCYRNLIHNLEGSSFTHNTCTFTLETTGGPEVPRTRTLEQSRAARRHFDPLGGRPFPPMDRGARLLLASRRGRITALASEAGALYEAPIQEFIRFWFLCGTHGIFVVDQIRSSAPVKTSWNWLLNNRDGALHLKLLPPDRLVARRGNAGMKLFHLGGGTVSPPSHAFVHDAYHPLPDQLGEGRSGSGCLVRWTEKTASTARTVVHALCVDDPGGVSGWHLLQEESAVILEGPEGCEKWKLEIAADSGRFTLSEMHTGETCQVIPTEHGWKQTG